jgi:hypothetical protein
MAQLFTDVLTQDQLEAICALPEVVEARRRLDSGAPFAYFSIRLDDSIKHTLRTKLGVDLSTVSAIPMRWIRGDTAPHIDRGSGDFSTTYLLYLKNGSGEFLVDGDTYTITDNSAFVFQEGLSHETLHTGSEPRLLLGPMSEQGFAVGAPMFYFATEADALAFTSWIAYSSSYTVGDLTGGSGSIAPYTSWRLASNSTGSSSQAIVYPNGSTLNAGGTYNLYPAAPCFLEGSKILCLVNEKEQYVPVEEMKKGTIVKTVRNGYKKVELIGKAPYSNPGDDSRIQNRLYVLSPNSYPELTEDLILTGCHSILVDTITDIQRQETIKSLGKIFVTDKKYRLMACLDDRAVPLKSEGSFTVYHFALEDKDDGINFGVYANGGLLVETCSLRFLKQKSNMTLF